MRASQQRHLANAVRAQRDRLEQLLDDVAEVPIRGSAPDELRAQEVLVDAIRELAEVEAVLRHRKLRRGRGFRPLVPNAIRKVQIAIRKVQGAVPKVLTVA